MYHWVIFFVLLVAAVNAQIPDITFLNGLIDSIALTGKCITATSSALASKVKGAYFVYYRSVPSFCCGIALFDLTTAQFVTTGRTTFVLSSNCSTGQTTGVYTTAAEAIPESLEPIILYIDPLHLLEGQLIMVSAPGASGTGIAAIFTVLGQYSNYQCIFSQTCIFRLSGSDLTFANNNYNIWCKATGLTIDFGISALQQLYNMTLYPVVNQTGCTPPP